MHIVYVRVLIARELHSPYSKKVEVLWKILLKKMNVMIC